MYVRVCVCVCVLTVFIFCFSLNVWVLLPFDGENKDVYILRGVALLLKSTGHLRRYKNKAHNFIINSNNTFILLLHYFH